MTRKIPLQKFAFELTLGYDGDIMGSLVLTPLRTHHSWMWLMKPLVGWFGTWTCLLEDGIKGYEWTYPNDPESSLLFDITMFGEQGIYFSAWFWHIMASMNSKSECFKKIKYLFFVWKNDIHLRHMSGKLIYFSDLNFWKSLENETFQIIVNPVIRKSGDFVQ